jgi:hypothetical protein
MFILYAPVVVFGWLVSVLGGGWIVLGEVASATWYRLGDPWGVRCLGAVPC